MSGSTYERIRRYYERRRGALARPCRLRTCRSPAGQPCRTPRGHIVSYFHTNRLALALAALGAVCLVTACTTATATAPPAASLSPSPAETEATRTAGAQHCGIERWPVKTGTDTDAGKVDLTAAQPTTIAHLAALTPPAVLPQAARVGPVEMTVYQVTATLREFKIEADSDVHLVLSTAGQTMIAEIPDPACVGAGSPFLPRISAARAAFDTRFHPSDVWKQSGASVVVTGVGFFDSLHGQTGVAGNGVELHPALALAAAP